MYRTLAGTLAGVLLAFTALASNAQAVSLGPELSTQAKQKTSNEGAETLYSIVHSSLDDKGDWERVSYYSIRINDQEAARDYGRLVIPYNHYYNSAELQFANVLSADGSVKPVSKDAVQVRTVGGGQDFYDDRSEIVFSLPDVAPGAIIEFQLQTKTIKRAITSVDFDSASPFWFQQRVANDGWRADSVKNFSYRVEMPAGKTFHTRVYGPYSSKHKTGKANKRVSFEWRWKNVEAIILENAMLPEHQVMPSIKLSNTTDWSLVNRWNWEKVENKLSATSKIKAVVKSLNLPQSATRDEKIKAVYRYINDNVRYVFAHLGRGGYDPHFPDETLQNGYGDCKDQTVLALAMLKALGVQAHAALVETPRSGFSDMELVRLIFDHMIVWVAPEGDSPAQWLDTTGDRTLYPGVSNFLVGQPALIVDNKNGLVTHVDAELQANVTRLNLVYREANGHSLVEVNYLPSGIYEQNMRSWWKHDTNRETSLQHFMEAVFENPSEYTLQADVLNAEELFKPFEIKAVYKFKARNDDTQATVYGASFQQIYRLAGEISSMQIPSSRKNVWYTPMAIELSLTAQFSGGKNTIPALIQSGKSLNNEYFSFQQKGYSEGNDFIVEINYQRPSLELDVEQYADFHAQLLKLGTMNAWVVSMLKDDVGSEQQSVEQQRNQHGENSLEYQLTLARHHLNLGEFELALAPAKEAVRLAPKDGEAWFVLGTAQGFNTLIDDSNTSFENARALGYTP